MRIPKVISKNNREYIFEKQCNENMFLYREMIHGYRTCFTKFDLGIIKQADDYEIERKIIKSHDDKKQEIIRKQVRSMLGGT
jgi:hypothetical protein